LIRVQYCELPSYAALKADDIFCRRSCSLQHCRTIAAYVAFLVFLALFAPEIPAASAITKFILIVTLITNVLLVLVDFSIAA
jgi:hypothetical protein